MRDLPNIPTYHPCTYIMHITSNSFQLYSFMTNTVAFLQVILLWYYPLC